MEISAALVKELRERTGAGMMECKKALLQSKGDIESAIEEMRKSGVAKAAKKASRIASEGMVYCLVDHQGAVMFEVNCETDFVARGDDFVKFVQSMCRAALNAKISDLDRIAALTLPEFNGKTVETVRQELIAKLGENIQIRRGVYHPKKGLISHYLHGQRIGVLVDIAGTDEVLAKDLAMHVAASQPLVVAPEDVPAEFIEKEKVIFHAQAAESGKPADIVEKMVQGRIKKYLSEVSLMGQPFVKDPNMMVADLLKQKQARVVTFIRYEVGEGIEKKKDDFVAEVMAQARGE